MFDIQKYDAEVHGLRAMERSSADRTFFVGDPGALRHLLDATKELRKGLRENEVYAGGVFRGGLTALLDALEALGGEEKRRV